MPRKLSTIAPDWWDYTTLENDLIRDAAKLTPRQIEKLARPGFRVVMYDTLEDFYLAEALEYIDAWRVSTPDNPVGICGPIGPTEQLPLVARLVNALEVSIRSAHFWGMDEWYDGKREVSAKEYRKLGTRIVDLHPVTLAQNARTSGGGNISLVPQQAITVGPRETWLAEKVSIWQAGAHDSPFGQRLTTLMISKGIADSAVPMSLLADHPNVQFNFFRGGLGTCEVEMH
jgi:hypothetical protein